MLLALIWQHAEGAQEAAQGATAEHAAQAAEHSAHHTPWIVEQVNHLFGPAVYQIQKAVMPSIMQIFKQEWHGDPDMPIPTHIVMALLSFLICTVGLLLFRGKLSVDKPSNRQQVLEGIALQVRDVLDQVIGPYGRRYFPV